MSIYVVDDLHAHQPAVPLPTGASQRQLRSRRAPSWSPQPPHRLLLRILVPAPGQRGDRKTRSRSSSVPLWHSASAPEAARSPSARPTGASPGSQARARSAGGTPRVRHCGSEEASLTSEPSDGNTTDALRSVVCKPSQHSLPDRFPCRDLPELRRNPGAIEETKEYLLRDICAAEQSDPSGKSLLAVPLVQELRHLLRDEIEHAQSRPGILGQPEQHRLTMR